MEISYLSHLLNENIYYLEKDKSIKEYPTIEIPKVKLAILITKSNDEEDELLLKIIDSISLTNEEYKIIHSLPQNECTFEKLLVFDEALMTQFNTLNLFTIQKIDNFEVLVSPTLQHLIISKDLKIKLWKKLKEWFNI